MRTLFLLGLASCTGGFSLHGGASSSSSSSSGAGASPLASGNAQDAYHQFAIQGVELGAALEAQAGFTCGPPRGTGGFTTQNHSCVKFVDERCKERPTKIHHIRSSADLDKGQTCFMDEFTGATYLDRDLLAPPLKSLRIVGTDSDHPKIFELYYTFAGDDLTDDSKLGKALLAKYGPPTVKNPPIGMVWERGDVRLSASCRTIAGDHAAQGDFCTISVEDAKLDETEREHQRQADDAARKRDAPPPPQL